MTRNKHHGSSFESFLAKDGLLEECEFGAMKMVIAMQIASAMKTQGLTKTAMAAQMQTTRAQLDRLLDPIPKEPDMKTYPLNEARADFSRLVERALAGEPQRITRYGKEAVIVVSEEAWAALSSSAAPTLGALLAQHARAGKLADDMTDRPWKD